MKQWILIVAAMLAITGCQRRSFDEGGGGNDAFAIRFSVENTIQVEPGTKTGVTPAVDLPVGATVRVLAFDKDVVVGTDPAKANVAYIVKEGATAGTLELLPCKVDDAGKFLTYDGAEAMELSNGTYDFYAYTPARKIESNATVKGIGHYLDFMASDKTTKTVSRSAAEVPLSFEHKNAKITFVVKSSADMSAKDSLCVDSVKLRNMGKLSSDYKPGGDLATALGGLTDSSVVRKERFSYITAGNKKAGVSGSEVLLPKPSGKVPVEFYVSVDTTEYLLKATLPDTQFGKGKNYKFTMLVKQGSVELYLNIVSWNYVATNESAMGDSGNILIGSWGNVDWSGEMGGNMDPVTGKIEIGSWTAVDLPADFEGAHNGGVGGWGDSSMGGDLSGSHGGGIGSWGGSSQTESGLGEKKD